MIIVSIVVLAYNHEKYISETIESIKKLKYSLKKEVIIIDVGSTDGTLKEIKKAAADIQKVTIISENAMSFSACFNNAYHLAQGEYICVLNGDERLTPESIDLLYNVAKENNIDFVVGERGTHNLKLDSSNNIKKDFNIIYEPIREILTSKKFYKTGLASGGAFIKRSLIEKVGGSDIGCFYPDLSIGLRCGKYSHFAIVKAVICFKQSEVTIDQKEFNVYDCLQAVSNFIDNHSEIAQNNIQLFYKFLYKMVLSIGKKRLYNTLKMIVSIYQFKHHSLSDLKAAYRQELKKLR
jgi:glycosyltransferase involved in cell wall biosynthesis